MNDLFVDRGELRAHDAHSVIVFAELEVQLTVKEDEPFKNYVKAVGCQPKTGDLVQTARHG
jgi:hypothetical protein